EVLKLKKEDIAFRLVKNLNRPATAKTLMRMLQVDSRQRLQFKNILKQLVRDGRLIKIRGNRYAPPGKLDLVIGTYDPARRGDFGFVIPDDISKPEVFIRTSDSMGALPGDKVAARIEGYRDELGPRGKIIRIIEENFNSLVGKFHMKDGFGIVIPFSKKIRTEIFIPHEYTNKAKSGQYVFLEIKSRSPQSGMMIGEITEIIGDINTKGIDREVIITEFGLRDEFPEHLKKELKKLDKVSTYGYSEKDRLDFTDQICFTIDGKDARDFDDAVSLETRPEGWTLYVHIADVSEYIQPKSAIDKEAYIRGTSVYFTEKALPMLPVELSNGVCSLRENEKKLTVSAIININEKGFPTSAKFGKSMIKSAKRFTYDEVFDLVKGNNGDNYPQEIVNMVHQMHALSRQIRRNRFKRGSIDFDFPEIGVSLNDDLSVKSITRREMNESHQIIEEFMILANEAVAEFLSLNHSPTLYRIHDKPDEMKINEFLETYESLGFGYIHDKQELSSRELSELLKKASDTVYEPLLGRMLLRSMKLARYSPQNIGHYALSSKYYLHFTSPIRRYPDIIVHRSLKELLNSGKNSLKIKMDQRPDVKKHDTDEDEENYEYLIPIGAHCSARERLAEEASRELIRWRQIKYMQNLKEDKFNALIIDITARGLFIELIDYYLEGFVHISDIYDDFYHYDHRRKMLLGEKTGRMYKVGQTIEVLTSNIDIEQREIEFVPYGLDLRRKGKIKSKSAWKR
ncbi:MAG: ribonuclease R, partial [Acidobacteria bacterium]|nr:ribonuclease R [Acidobacteriota bacterium]